MLVRSAVALIEGRQVRVLGQERSEGRDGAQHADVAQPPVALLEVGLQKKGDVAGRGAAIRHLLFEQRQVPCREPVAPGGLRLLEEGLGHPGLAPDEPAVQQTERHPHVLGGGTQHFGGPADGVVEVHSFVPHRVPDGVGDLRDVPVAVVDEHHIEVAIGAERGPAVPADGNQGQMPGGVAGGAFGQAGEPDVRLGRIAPTELLPLQAGFGQEPAASIPQ